LAHEQQFISSNNASTVELDQRIAEGSVDGQVSCVEGPMSNATVSIGVLEAVTDAKGSFLLEHVPLGIALLRVRPSSNRYHEFSQDVLIEPDKNENLFVFLTEVTGTIEGIVTGEKGEPLVGATISGLFRLGKPDVITQTDRNGHYYFGDILRGSYYLRAKAKGYMIQGVSVDVAGNKAVADFGLKSASLSISGIVLSKKEKTAVDCQIYLMRDGIVVTTAITSQSGNGKFSFDDLVPGTYEMSTLANGYSGQGIRVELQKSETVSFELEKA
jgi:hypothetical protein